MLKIRDDVDLKKLKEFGFDFYDDCGQYKFIERFFCGADATYIYINAWNRKIIYRQEEKSDNMCLEKLYDLIEANLVEKSREE